MAVTSVSVKVASGDPPGKWRSVFVNRGNPLLQLEPLGPHVRAADPQELEEQTDAALIAKAAGGESN